MKIADENILEPFFRYIRYKEGLGCIKTSKSVTIVDLGSGPKAEFYDYALHGGVIFKQYIGIDPLISNETIEKYKKGQNFKLIQSPLVKTIPLKDESVDYVVGLAFLEHLDNPQDIMLESIRVLKKGGIAIFTTPAPRAKSVLEFLSFKLNLISKELIEEHKLYLNKKRIFKMLNSNKQIELLHRYFEFGFNNLIVIKKK